MPTKDTFLQERELADWSAERRSSDVNPAVAAEGGAWHTHFGVFYKLVYENVATLVEVSSNGSIVTSVRIIASNVQIRLNSNKCSRGETF